MKTSSANSETVPHPVIKPKIKKYGISFIVSWNVNFFEVGFQSHALAINNSSWENLNFDWVGWYGN